MAAVFLSYAPDDQATADALAAAMGTLALEVLRFGDAPTTPFEAERRLRSADAVVVLWTPASLDAPTVLHEASLALGVGRLVNVAQGARPPPPFDQTRTVDLAGWRGRTDETPWRQLADQLLSLTIDPVASSHAAAAAPAAAARRPVGPSVAALGRERLAAAASGLTPFALAATEAVVGRHDFDSAPVFAAAPPPPMPAASAEWAPPTRSAAPMATAAGRPTPADRSPRGPGRLGLLASGAVVVIGAISATTLLKVGSRPPAPVSQAPLTETGPAPTAASPNTGGAIAPEPFRFTPRGRIYGPDEATNRIVQAEGPVRLVVRDADGKVYFAQALADGEAYRVPDLPNLTVDVSGAGEAELFADGVAARQLRHGVVALPAIANPGEPNLDNGVAAQANVLGVLPLIGAMALPPAIETAEPVDVSVFAPGALRTGDQALVQVYLHPIDQVEVAGQRARAADPDAQTRGTATLDVDLARGAKVCVMLDPADGLSVDEPQQFLVWNGRPVARQFVVSASAESVPGQRVLIARLLVDGIPVGRLAFTLRVVGVGQEFADTHGLRGDRARRYTRAFLSYSSLDRPEVLKSAQALRASGISFFQDILSIEPGEAWRERLFAEIDRCDLFLLFWSSHSARSEWVLREAEYAMSRRKHSTDETPDITPIVLEGPPVPKPPEGLQSLHFNDMLRYVAAAAEMEASARGTPEA